MKKIKVLGLLILLLILIVSCASNAKSTQNMAVEHQAPAPIESQNEIPEIIPEGFWNLSKLEGTKWEYETEMHGFQAWRGFEIKGGMAYFYQKMGNAIDIHEGETISLEGNVIRFSRSDGGGIAGDIDEEKFVVHGIGETYYLVK